MSRLILIALLILAIVIAASAVASVFRAPARPSTPAQAGAPSGTLPKIAFGLLMIVMFGVGSGMMGAD